MIPEELLDLFFTKKQMYKLKILRELRQGSISTLKIEQSLRLLKRETREIKQALIQDINNILAEHSCNKLTINQDHLIFSPPITEEQYVDLLDNMKEMYFLSSPLYKLLIFVLEKRRFTLIEIASSLSYSESHSYKILNKLKEFFFYQK